MARLKSAVGEVEFASRRSPQKNATSSRANAVSSFVVPEYSPGRRQKKNAIHTTFARPFTRALVEPGANAVSKAFSTTVMGMGLTRLGGLSSR